MALTPAKVRYLLSVVLHPCHPHSGTVGVFPGEMLSDARFLSLEHTYLGILPPSSF